MGLGPGDECDAGHGPVPRKIEALNTGTTCPSRDREKWGKERIPSASPVGNELNQEEYQSCTGTSVQGGFSLRVEMGLGSSWALAVEGAGTGAGTDLSEINVHLLWRPLGAALAQSRIIHSSRR